MNIEQRGKGFTLIEMLVSVAVFMLVMLAVYAFFDQGQWLYMHAERRSNIQDLARLAVEQMERDFRMIGSNVPTGGAFNAGTQFSPTVIFAGPSKIGFYSDINNGSTRITQDVASTSVNVENGTVCGGGVPAVITKDMRQWLGVTCTMSSATLVSLSAIPSGCTAEECFITTPERVWYRLNGDTDNDGTCNTTTPPFCTLQRAEIATNAPLTTEPSDSEFVTMATNIKSLVFTYSDMDGPAYGTSATGGQLFGVTRISINLIATDYGVGQVTADGAARPDSTQDINLLTEAMVRDARY